MELEDVLQKIHVEKGFNSKQHSEKEFKLAAVSMPDEKKLRKSYVIRLKAFMPYLGAVERERAAQTIANLRS